MQVTSYRIHTIMALLTKLHLTYSLKSRRTISGDYSYYSAGTDLRLNYKQNSNPFGDNFLYFYEPLGVRSTLKILH